MALEDEMQEEQQAPSEERLSDDEEMDLEIAVMFAQKIIDEGGISVIEDAVKTSRDPGQVVGQFMMQLVSQMNENLPEGVELSKRIYFARDGWIEQVSDYLQDEYNIGRDVMDRAEMYIGSSAQQMAQGAAQQAGGQQPGTTAPAGPAPAGAPVMPGGAV